MALLISALIVAAAIVWSGRLIAAAQRTAMTSVSGERALRLLELFAPALVGAARDVREILVWQPLATAARRLFPDDFASLDRASSATFPFAPEQLQAAHARWTAEWLAWE